jgi:hypothetical protein
MKMGIQGMVVLLIASMGGGCLPFDKQPPSDPAFAGMQQAQQPQQPPQAPVENLPPSNLKLEAMFHNKIYLAPDTQNGGKEIPGLHSRIYLFGPDGGTSLLRDGELVVKIFDATNRDAPKEMEAFVIDPVSFRRTARKDIIGDGYTIFFPLSHYSQSLARVNIQVVFTPIGKQPLMQQCGTITLDHSIVQTREAERKQEKLKEARPAL